MKARRWLPLLPLLPLLLAVAALAVCAATVHAQVVPPTAVPGSGYGDLIKDPNKWLTDMFNGALQAISKKTSGDVVDFMDWLLGGANVISQTPPALSYDNDAVKDLSYTLQKVANGGLAVVSVWGGVNLMVHPHTRTPYHGLLELLPRLLLSGIMVNTSLEWGRFVIDLNNRLCELIGSTSVPAWASVVQVPQDGSGLMHLIAMAIYLIMGMLLVGQMLMRLALIAALLVVAPLALLCWVLPQTYHWAQLWFSTFFGAVFVQALQVLVLRLGADMITRLPSLLPALGDDPLERGRLWMATLLLGVAVLQLARRIPRLIPGLPVGGFPAVPRARLDSGRDVAWLVRMAGALKGKV